MCAYHSSFAESTIIQEMKLIKKGAYDRVMKMIKKLVLN
jgi:hypothetical protein